jgi:hypothetical protein
MLSRRAAVAASDDWQRRSDLTDDAILAIVMAAAATEAFINEFAEYVSASIVSSSEVDMILPQVAACADVLQELEDSRASVTAKYLAASLVVSGSSKRRHAHASKARSGLTSGAPSDGRTCAARHCAPRRSAELSAVVRSTNDAGGCGLGA